MFYDWTEMQKVEGFVKMGMKLLYLPMKWMNNITLDMCSKWRNLLSDNSHTT